MLFFNNMTKMASGNCVGKAGNACNDFHLLTLYQTTKCLDWSKFKAFANNKINVP